MTFYSGDKVRIKNYGDGFDGGTGIVVDHEFAPFVSVRLDDASKRLLFDQYHLFHDHELELVDEEPEGDDLYAEAGDRFLAAAEAIEDPQVREGVALMGIVLLTDKSPDVREALSILIDGV